jgi:hypothetical protein
MFDRPMVLEEQKGEHLEQSQNGSSRNSACDQIHVIVLVHGIKGNRKELDYMKKALEEHAQSETATFIIHSATSNENQTLDGIDSGGIRLANEINELLSQLQHQHKDAEISLSFIGHSLGGLYSRYALAHIVWKGIRPVLFLTTATPHLGLQGHTYLKLPRSMEYLVALSMGKTGLDLFRYTNIVNHLCLDETFLKPLRAFEKRLAYANAHGTDFPVPTATAAFLADTDSPHGVVATEDENDSFASTFWVETPRNKATISIADHGEAAKSPSTATLARNLDSVGWTKFFFDVRPHLPSIWNRTSSSNRNTFPLPKGEHFTSADVLASVASPDWYTLPFGHSFLVASAKNWLYEWFYRGGRPLVDRIAREIIRDVMELSVSIPNSFLSAAECSATSARMESGS